MAEQHTYKHLPEENCLSQDELFRYIDGKLSPAAMHAAEKHMLDCDLCSDAFEGLQLVRNREKASAFIPPAAKTEPEPEKESDPVILPLYRKPAFWYSAAASVILVLGVITVMKLSLKSGDMAAESKVLSMNESSSAKADSISSPVPVTASGQAQGISGNAAQSEPDLQKPLAGATVNNESSLMTDQEAADIPAEEKAADGQMSNSGSSYKDNDKELEDQKSGTNPARASGASTGDQRSEAPAKNKDKKDAADKLKDLTTKVATMKKSEQAASAPKTTLAESNEAPPPPSQYDMKNEGAKAGAASADDYVISANDTVSSQGPYPLSTSPSGSDLYYEKGLKQLEAGNAETAIGLFDQVLKNTAHPHYEDAQWKKAEALISLNRKDEAKSLLQTIVSKGGKYKSQAEEKLKTL